MKHWIKHNTLLQVSRFMERYSAVHLVLPDKNILLLKFVSDTAHNIP